MRLPSLALEQELTVYDAAYLDLALRLGLPMATKDEALKRAMANSGVKLIEPEPDDTGRFELPVVTLLSPAAVGAG